jgi:hypothetical protein
MKTPQELRDPNLNAVQARKFLSEEKQATPEHLQAVLATAFRLIDHLERRVSDLETVVDSLKRRI